VIAPVFISGEYMELIGAVLHSGLEYERRTDRKAHVCVAADDWILGRYC
jgi:hypothetical protein